MKKILLASGCSFTDKNWISDFHPEIDTSFPKWPELLAKKLDMECINLGKSGSGNEFIYSSILDYLTDKKTIHGNIGLVVAAWSQCNRKDFQGGREHPYWMNEMVDPHGNVFSFVKRTMRNMMSFQILCESFNVPYLHFQMLELFKGYLAGLLDEDGNPPRPNNMHYTNVYEDTGNIDRDIKQCFDIILSYDDKLETNRFLGWPINEQFGGFTLCKKMDRLYDKIKPPGWSPRGLRMSRIDGHPNKQGHKAIANLIYDRLDERILTK
tara:strand:+ start:2671 stop:3471 length:801 start_codon:yes stop_codon:yes gene_type:complete